MNYDEKKFLGKLAQIETLVDLEDLRIEYLGRNGIINQLLKKIVEIPPMKRRAMVSR